MRQLILLVALAATCTADKSVRIIGGVPAQLGELPWQACLHNNGRHWCGGAVLNEKWVLTAAHCHVSDLSKLMVMAGFVNMMEPGSTVQMSMVSRFIAHSKYNEAIDPYHYDVGVVELTKKLQFNSFVSPIALPVTGYVGQGDGEVSGWGAVREGGPMSPELMRVTVPVMPLATCQDYYGDEVDSTVLCAGYEQGGKDSCQGDSGGPLTCTSNSGSRFICGIVSAGEGCGREGVPGLYTAVSSYLDWIHTQTR